jgi:two-component system chemotaxis response regulator CheB
MAIEPGPATYDAIAIGGSWGALEVTLRILEVLPASLPCPVFLVLHQRPALDSRLVEILERRSPLTPVSPEDKTGVAPGHLYVAPPGYHMLVNRDLSIGLAVYGHVHFSRPSIDETFFSVGHVYGAGATGVILTGANEDGAAGIGYIARRGGTAVAQDPGSAEARMMPEAAIATGHVQRVLATDNLGGFLRDRIIGV